jgi:CubicO group peptidase (beta-lactamase class C family)
MRYNASKSLSMKTILLTAVAVCLFLALAPTPEVAGASQYEQELHSVDSFLRTRTSPFPFSGSVLVAIDGSIALNKAYGDADYELPVKNTPETIYRIGSLTKPFTATAAMTLVEKHQLALDDPICRYIRNCPPAWSPVLVKHLLSHTSGIPDLFNAVPETPLNGTVDAIDKTIQSAPKVDLDSTPGLHFAYRNFNYMLVGYIIETVTKKGWAEVLRSNVLDPAATTQTGYDDVWAIVPGRARGYDVKEGRMLNVAYKDYSAYAAGGLLSTVHDLFAFQQALASGRILQPATLAEMLTPRQDDYGYGWQIKHYFGQKMYNHTGGTYGFASHLAVYPDQRLIIIVLSNVESEPAKLTACKIAGLLLTHREVGSCPQN